VSGGDRAQVTDGDQVGRVEVQVGAPGGEGGGQAVTGGQVTAGTEGVEQPVVAGHGDLVQRRSGTPLAGHPVTSR